MNILEINNVSKSYTGHQALKDVSFTVPEGSIYGLLGPNGAGKTTLIRIINHITAPDKGNVSVFGHQLTAKDTALIGYLPEERGLYKKMKVMEQAMFFARLKGLSKADARQKINQWFERLGIQDWKDKKVEELSKGMAQKVQFVITVLHNPRLLIFDEPFSGFDPVNANILKREILQLRKDGASVIFSTHNMSSVEELCDDITLINKSQNILTGNVKEIRTAMGKDRYYMEFGTSEPENIISMVSPLVTDLERVPSNESVQIKFKLSQSDMLPQVIDIVNHNASLKMLKPVLMSMDDIFINAVTAIPEYKGDKDPQSANSNTDQVTHQPTPPPFTK